MTGTLDPATLPAGVAAVLGRLGDSVRLHGHPRWRTTEELRPGLESQGFDAQAMLKTLAFQAPAGIALVTLRMLDKVDYAAVARALGVPRSALGLLDGATLQSQLGMEPGAVCPFAERSDVRLLLDARALANTTIYCGSGTLSCTVEIASHALRAIRGAEVGAFSKVA